LRLRLLPLSQALVDAGLSVLGIELLLLAFFHVPRRLFGSVGSSRSRIGPLVFRAGLIRGIGATGSVAPGSVLGGTSGRLLRLL